MLRGVSLPTGVRGVLKPSWQSSEGGDILSHLMTSLVRGPGAGPEP